MEFSNVKPRCFISLCFFNQGYFDFMQSPEDLCFWRFKDDIGDIDLPERFTFPFYYDPHPLCVKAAEQLQDYIQHHSQWEHNFGLEEGKSGMVIGKMFGVLLVRNSEGELGFLAAFSGKLAGVNHHPGFVPPVFDMLQEDGFFRIGEEELNAMNREIERLESSRDLKLLQDEIQKLKDKADDDLARQKEVIREGKKRRKQKREEALKELNDQERLVLEEELRQESLREQYLLKDMIRYWKYTLADAGKELTVITEIIVRLKEERKFKSAQLQQWLFDEYSFSDKNGHLKSIGSIFENTFEKRPPAGAGECATPKLLQYAFLHYYEPLAMAEFWWGSSPVSEIRKLKQFYPACKGKCEPILAHMLNGIETDDNPLMQNEGHNKEIQIIYDDEYLVVVNKQEEFLSVPGKSITDSVYSRIKELYPEAAGPLIVHRLDMSTSGLMVVAKSMDVYRKLQYQFIKRSVKKRYEALLDGIVEEDEGVIDLPLRLDIDDRPRQLVCYAHGKSARTIWRVVGRKDEKTRIHFYPVTGRTHQLRVHASHPLGLNTPIVGDDLYGIKADRLHLHAAYLEIEHPVTRERMSFNANPDF